MSKEPREVKESPLPQGIDEHIAYVLDTTPWGGSPTVVSVKLYDSDYTDVSETKLTGDPSTAGNFITTPSVSGLDNEETYRLEILFTVPGGNILEAYAFLNGER